MSRVLLLQLDGKLPNIALMRIASHHRKQGNDVEFRRISNPRSVERGLWDDFDAVYASLLFTRTRSLAERLKVVYPEALIGGTGWDCQQDNGLISLGGRPATTLKSIGIEEQEKDYSIYPDYQHSIGYTQRGCRLNQKTCPWCIVPLMEGKISPDESIGNLWRGDPYPRNLHLLDNDFFGHPDWRGTVVAIRDGGFKVCFNQGVNVRLMTEEQAEAVCSTRYYDDDFENRRFYTAWDSKPDEDRLFRGLNWLVKYGMRPDHIMVYMLIGVDGETHEDREYRRKRLRDFGARPYPMPLSRTPELVGFQRWVVRRADLMIPWEDYKAASYRPENVERAA